MRLPAHPEQRNIDCPVRRMRHYATLQIRRESSSATPASSLDGGPGRAAQQQGVIMLGGGNPSHIPQVEEAFRTNLERLLDSEIDLERLIGEYGGPAGHQPFIDALVDMLRTEYGWDIDARNIALTNGSQTAFFYLFNLVAGEFPDGSRKRILLPLAPEYIGYADVGIAGLALHCAQAADRIPGRSPLQVPRRFRRAGDHRRHRRHLRIAADQPHRQRADRRRRSITSAASPRRTTSPSSSTTPTARPSPHIIFTEATPHWEPHKILCMSLSKLGIARRAHRHRRRTRRDRPGPHRHERRRQPRAQWLRQRPRRRRRAHTRYSRPEPARHQAPLLAQGPARRRLRCAMRSTARTSISTNRKARSSCGSGSATCPSRARNYTND